MDSTQIGTILLGLGTLCIALLLQMEFSYEGFQGSSVMATGSGSMGSGSMGSGSMGSGSMGSMRMGLMPMGSITMGSGLMGSTPMGSTPMGSTPMGSTPMGSVPMGSMPIPSVSTGPAPIVSRFLSEQIPPVPLPVVPPEVATGPAPLNPNLLSLYQSSLKAASNAAGAGSGSGSGSGSSSLSSLTAMQRFALKNAEISDMFNMIKANKMINDKTLTLVLDPEVYNKLQVLSMELSNYIDMMSQTYSLSEQNTDSMKQLQLTVYQEAQTLYNIYVTMPSTVISTNLIVDSSTANLSSLNDPAVVRETKDAITSLLTAMPTASQKITSYEQMLTTNFNAIIQNTSNLDQITQLNGVFTKYKSLIDLQLQSYTNSVSANQVLDNKNITIVNTMNDGLKLVSSVNRYLSDMSRKLKSLPPSSINTSIQTLIQTIDSTIQGYETKKTFINDVMQSGSIPVKESFQSYQNPYNEPSLSQNKVFSLGRLVDADKLKESFQSYQNPYNAPSLAQSKEFALEKRGLIHEVSAFMN
jgi:hypothetical protein